MTPDDTTREEMIRELFGRLDAYMTSVLVESFKEEDLEVFIKMSNENKPQEELERFIIEKIPNAQSVMAQAMADFRETYLQGVAVSRNTPQGSTDSNNPNPES